MSDETIDYEAEARSQGWRPQEEWKGDPEQWKDAQQFVEDGKNILPLVQSKNRKLQEQLDKVSERVDQLMASNKKLNEMSQKAIEREKAEKEQLREQLRAARKQAVAEGDGEAFDEAERKLEQLEEPPSQNTGGQLTAEQQEWLNHNSWYGKDDQLTAFADGMAERLNARGYYGTAYFDKLTEEVKNAFPQKFEKKSAPTVEGEGKKEKASPTGRTYDDLPPEAKKACDEFVRDIPGYKKEMYLEQYDWSE